MGMSSGVSETFLTEQVNVVSRNGDAANLAISGFTRVSQLLTLFDGKILNAEDSLKWDTKGTGSATYSDNGVTLSVTAGQYLVRQGRFFCPYFSGKPQIVELTSINMQNQEGLVKRMGYFSSNAVAPYDSGKDGVWLEADGTSYRLITSRNGAVIHNIPWTSWDNYDLVKNYDWSKFSAVEMDFLWLGGAGLRFFLVVDGQFQLIHTIKNHAGDRDGLIFNSPNQPVRYEIRSTTGTGSLRSVCSQVATEGGTPNESGEGLSWYSPLLTCNSVGQVYALVGARLQVAQRNRFVPVTQFGGALSTNDTGILMLLLNPALSTPLTWTNVSRTQQGRAVEGTTVTNPGRILKVVPVVSSGVAIEAPAAALRTLACGIDNTLSEIVVAYAPLTASQAISGTIQVMEY